MYITSKNFLGPARECNELAIKWAQLGPKRGQNEVLDHFLVHNALVFVDFVYYDRELWYPVGSGGQSDEKNLLALKWAQLGPKMGQNEVLGHFLV